MAEGQTEVNIVRVERVVKLSVVTNIDTSELIEVVNKLIRDAVFKADLPRNHGIPEVKVDVSLGTHLFADGKEEPAARIAIELPVYGRGHMPFVLRYVQPDGEHPIYHQSSVDTICQRVNQALAGV